MDEFKLVPEESVLFDLSPNEAVLFFYAVGFMIDQVLTIDELRFLGTGFSLMGSVVLTIVAQQVLLDDALAVQQQKSKIDQPASQSKVKLQCQISNLKNQIQHLQRQIDQYKSR